MIYLGVVSGNVAAVVVLRAGLYQYSKRRGVDSWAQLSFKLRKRGELFQLWHNNEDNGAIVGAGHFPSGYLVVSCLVEG